MAKMTIKKLLATHKQASKYAFKVRTWNSDGGYSFLISAYTLEEAQKLAKDELGDAQHEVKQVVH